MKSKYDKFKNLNLKIYSENLLNRKHNKKPKILINIRAFNNCYEQTKYDIVFGGRFNVIKNDFETLLAELKSTGAELIFLPKKRNLSYNEDTALDTYRLGMLMVTNLSDKVIF
jgi:hypothetical protein